MASAQSSALEERLMFSAQLAEVCSLKFEKAPDAVHARPKKNVVVQKRERELMGGDQR